MASIRHVLKRGGFAPSASEPIPGWEGSPDDTITQLAVAALRHHMPTVLPRVLLSHPFIEPGLIVQRMNRRVQAVCFGPTIADMHSPMERVGIESFEISYKRLCFMLEELSRRTTV